MELESPAPACHAKNVLLHGSRPLRSALIAPLLIAACFVPTSGRAQDNAQPRSRQLQIESFETVWSTIRDTHWDPHPGGLDWDKIHAEYRPQIDRAATDDEVRRIIRAMLARLTQTHFALLAPGAAEDVADDGGDATPGFDVRILNDRVVITNVYSPASVHTGWIVLAAGKWDLSEALANLRADPSIPPYALERAIESRLTGPVGVSKHFAFLDGSGQRVELDLKLTPPRGELATFGNLPPQHVWFESKTIGNVKYVRLSEFLDLPRVLPAFGEAVEDCSLCAGIVIDLRGNPGGIGGMAMGMAGWLTNTANQRLGRMYTRGAALNFVINPRVKAFTGPVAILVDATSASTSEIFAGGLQDLHRARIFGTKTAGAALPSVFTRLPSGDGFQYAVANYISEGGRALEGNGVTPDVQVELTREGLLAGHDAVIDAAFQWIRGQAK